MFQENRLASESRPSQADPDTRITSGAESIAAQRPLQAQRVMEIESGDKSSHSKFLFVTCQVGAETAVKGELARDWPDFRFAYSRPGFLTFKLPADFAAADDYELRSVFARAHGFTLGKVTGEDIEARCRTARELIGYRRFNTLHVWQRDLVPVGQHGYEPGPSTLNDEAHQVAASPCLPPDILVV